MTCLTADTTKESVQEDWPVWIWWSSICQVSQLQYTNKPQYPNYLGSAVDYTLLYKTLSNVALMVILTIFIAGSFNVSTSSYAPLFLLSKLLKFCLAALTYNLCLRSKRTKHLLIKMFYVLFVRWLLYGLKISSDKIRLKNTY